MLASIVFLLVLVSAAINANVVSKVGPEGRIRNGAIAFKNQFPFMAYLKVYEIQNGKLGFRVCAGSILSPEYILTAAHCTTGKHYIQVSVGYNYFDEESSFFVHSDHIINHKEFHLSSFNHDISLLKIKTPLIFSGSIKSIRLPLITTPKNCRSSYLGERVILAGWGKSSPNEMCSSSLRYVEQRVASNEECHKFFGATTNNANLICISTPDCKSPDDGDSGGPLILPSSSVHGPILIGILSSGAENCVEGHPVKYMRVSSYLEWIRDNSGIAYF